ncbi:hypothetical protein RA27_00645 [Ruegeria sp. ANG-R]|uniref:efflux RND transporter periplasmic adaptor subunit n=1 Tax=Ruegeria sp. ANG-R TaxID=1577903 RepID=UPI00057E4464|nr:efflux RND transporter periplasmic adaptor subunit [Ruegeria sp. ANG-R]KIC41955.1 hypothetical protein RA27_00645 [Ruegeria sp. ANG-R]
MKFLRWIILTIFLTAVIGGLGFIKFTQISAAIAAGKAYPEHSESVEAVTTELSSFAPVTRLSGEVVVPNYVVIQSQHAGQITELGFDPGDRVEEGQLLVQLDVGSELARLTGARAEVELARLDLDRAEKLFGSGNANKVRLDQAQATYDMARSEVAVIEQTIAQKTIRAPFSGQTRPGLLSMGQYLTIGAEVTRITDQRETLWVDFRLPQFLGDLAVGDDLQIKDVQGQALAGRIISRGPEVAPNTRTRLYRAEVQLEAPVRYLSHGSFVEVELSLSAPVQVVELPVTALQSDAYGQFVNVLEPAEQEGAFRAKRNDVTDVYYHGDRVLIGGGLGQGQLVAADGAFKLYPGVLTYVVDDLPQAPQDAGGW